MFTKERLTSNYFLIVALLLGGFIRLHRPLSQAFAINDGGLFYQMTQELVANGFLLPLYSNYNGLEIPFAYPPLGFYLTGAFSAFLGFELLDVVRVMPALFSMASIAVFYLLARRLLEHDGQAALAVLMFALIPAGFDWLIMGGGLTRAPGFLFFLLTAWSTLRLFSSGERRDVWLAAGFGALTVLSHPEAALHTIATAMFFWLFFGRSGRSLKQAIAVAIIVVIATTPWWGVLLVRHGVGPLLTGGQTVSIDLRGSLRTLITLTITHEVLIPLIGLLGLVGLLDALWRRRWFFPAWLAAMFLASPRSAPLYLAPLVCLLAGQALYALLMCLAHRYAPGEARDRIAGWLMGWRPRLVLALSLAGWLFSGFAIAAVLALNSSLQPGDAAAFEWVQAHTPPESQFVILTGNAPFLDPVSEWFPVLAERVSTATTQGKEWDPGIHFASAYEQAEALQACHAEGLGCVMQWVESAGATVDYVFVRLGDQAGWADHDALAGVIVYQRDHILIIELEH